jgi:hypothetical protein
VNSSVKKPSKKTIDKPGAEHQKRKITEAFEAPL